MRPMVGSMRPVSGDLDVAAIAFDGLAVGTNFDSNGRELSPGNRIDVDISIPLDADGTAVQIIDTITGEVVPLGIVVVAGDSVIPPDVVPPEAVRVPEWADAASAPVDHEYRFSIGSVDGTTKWFLNDAAYPFVDPLELTQGEFVKFRLVNDSELLHPMHLHGQFFKVISRNGEEVDEGHFGDALL